MDSLLLAQDTWDLVLDANGNVAVASAPYARSQDVACAVRTQLGDVWYDRNFGIPYTTEVFGTAPDLQSLRQRVEAAALTVPGITAARCLFAGLNGRVLTGQVQVTDENTTSTVNF